MTDASDESLDLGDINATHAEAAHAASGFGVENRDTDRANAQEFASRFTEKLVYVPSAGWMYYDERRWVTDIDRSQTIMYAGELADALWRRARQQEEQDQAVTLARASRLESAKGLTGFLLFAAALMAKPITEFDTHMYLLNCPNGTFDLRTLEDVGRSPVHYITRLCPTPLDLDAVDEVWEKVLDEAFESDVHKKCFYQRWSGYCCTGDVREKKYVVTCGCADASKSTVSEPLTHVLGDVGSGGYTSVWDAEMIQANSNVNRQEKLDKVRAARFVIVSELERGSRMADNFVKQYTGGNTMDAKALYKGSYSYRPRAKLLMDTNYVPKSSDPAVHNRVILLPMNHVPKVLDRSIKKHLEENPGAHKAILAWAVKGCKEWWDAQSLGETPWLDEAKAKYIKDSDALVDFVSQCFDLAELPEDSVHSEIAWTVYRVWATENVGKPLTKRPFGQALEERGNGRDRVPAKGGTMRFMGIKLKATEELPTEVRKALWVSNVGNEPVQG